MNWPHAPLHKLDAGNAVIVTAATFQKLHHLNEPARLDRFLELLFDYAAGCGWSLQAWAILANHYHFVAQALRKHAPLGQMLGGFYAQSSRELNLLDGTPARKTWFQYWDTDLTYQRSYLTRLNYVQQNPVHHGLVTSAEDYRWCSATWMGKQAEKASSTRSAG
jgi:putative transposase